MTVDWFEVLADLQRSEGLSRADVARLLGFPESTVKAWYYGASEPNYRNGVALVALWRKTRPQADLPTREMPVSAARAR